MDSTTEQSSYDKGNFKIANTARDMWLQQSGFGASDFGRAARTWLLYDSDGRRGEAERYHAVTVPGTKTRPWITVAPRLSLFTCRARPGNVTRSPKQAHWH
jgi:hypothetical protein